MFPILTALKNMVIQFVFHSKMPVHSLCFAGLSHAFRQGSPCLLGAVHHSRGPMHAPSDACDLEDWHEIRVVITFASTAAGTKLHPAHLQFVIN